MPRQLPPLNALKAFEAAARHESFTRAAEELCVTQGAVSHQVKALEAELGLKLFNRERQRLLITEGGRAYLAVVRDAFDRIADGTQRLLQRQSGGALTVSTSPNFARSGWSIAWAASPKPIPRSISGSALRYSTSISHARISIWRSATVTAPPRASTSPDSAQRNSFRRAARGFSVAATRCASRPTSAAFHSCTSMIGRVGANGSTLPASRAWIRRAARFSTRPAWRSMRRSTAKGWCWPAPRSQHGI